MGGSVKVDSELNVGTVFKINISTKVSIDSSDSNSKKFSGQLPQREVPVLIQSSEYV